MHRDYQRRFRGSSRTSQSTFATSEFFSIFIVCIEQLLELESSSDTPLQDKPATIPLARICWCYFIESYCRSLCRKQV